MIINLINNFYVNIIIIFFIFIFILKKIFNDIKNKEINIIILTTIIIQSLFNILIPIFFISGCYLFDFCISNDLNLEKLLYIKAFKLTIVFLAGTLSGIILYKKYQISILEKFIKNKSIYLPQNIRIGLYSTFLITSFILIILGFTVGELYYNKLFSRVYNYYSWFLVTPTLLFEISKNKLKDLKLLASTYFLNGLVLFFGYGRTTNSMTLIVFSIFVFLISSIKDFNIRDLIILPFKNFKSKIISSTVIFLFFSIARSKYFEISESISNYHPNVPKLMALFLHGSIVLGFPLMNTWHMINSEKIDSNNIILTSTFWELITDIPLFGAIFRDSDIKLWVTKLPENLLGLNHQGEFGGYTFGSDFAYYSYADELWSYSLSFIISLINMYIIYFLAKNISSIIKNYFIKEKKSTVHYSVRPSIFLISNIGISSIVQNELFFSLITLLPFYLLGKYFSKE